MVLTVSSANTTLPALLTPPTSVDPKYRILDNLTKDQSKSIKELQQRIRDMFVRGNELHGVPLRDEEAWATTDECSWRFLKANKFNVNKAEAALMKTLQWRREFRPTEITPEEVEEEFKSGKAFWSGYDKIGRPVIHLASSKLKSSDSARFQKFIIFNLENSSKLCPEGIFQVTRTGHAKGLTMFNGLSIPESIKLVSIVQSHYPEKLGCSIDFDPTWVMWAVSSIMTTFMDDSTKSKLHLASSKPGVQAGKRDSSNSKAKETGGWVDNVEELVDASQLPIYLGGTYSIQYDHNVHWKPFVERVWNQ
ncbi:CRAL-TRIO domain-containing protein [Obelidium mucronatum]|nr:CRAL-TRIO domain-containing protein [Obelidium mucronatum]